MQKELHLAIELRNEGKHEESMVQYRGVEWIEYRLRCLIEQKIFDYEGDLRAMRLYQVKVRM